MKPLSTIKIARYFSKSGELGIPLDLGGVKGKCIEITSLQYPLGARWSQDVQVTSDPKDLA